MSHQERTGTNNYKALQQLFLTVRVIRITITGDNNHRYPLQVRRSSHSSAHNKHRPSFQVEDVR